MHDFVFGGGCTGCSLMFMFIYQVYGIGNWLSIQDSICIFSACVVDTMPCVVTSPCTAIVCLFILRAHSCRLIFRLRPTNTSNEARRI